MKAIILAAGMGTRLREIWQGPKPLFEIRGKSLLEYALDSLAKAGITHADIVVGFKANEIKAKFGENYNSLLVKYVDNPHYQSSGSMHSLFCALSCSTPEPSLVLDGDLVYPPRVIQRILEGPQDLAFLTESDGAGQETYVVLDNEDKISYLALNRALPQSLRLERVFEFNGLAKFSPEFQQRLRTRHILSPSLQAYYEEVAYSVCQEFCPWYGLHDPSLKVAEIDKPTDLERALKLIKSESL